MRFDLLSLKLFVTVCEQQSIARAAEVEHIAASAVSKRISDLEDALKAPLFYRTPRALEPTPAARALLRHARKVMRDLSELETELGEHAKGACGQIRIHASLSTIVQHLPQDLERFLVEHSGIRIELEEATSKDVVQAVEENRADIGIFGGCLPTPGLQIIPYRSERLVVALPIGHALSARPSLKFAELLDYDLVGPRKGSFLDALLTRAAADLEATLNLRVRVNGFDTVVSMVEARLGVGLVAEHCARRHLPGGRFIAIPLDESWATRQWKICVRDLPALPSAVRLLVNHLKPEAGLAPSRGARLAGVSDRIAVEA